MLDTHFLVGTSFSSYDTGSYARVFVNQERLRAIKVFYRGKNRAHLVEVFESEFNAYELVQSAPDLVGMTPRFYGCPSISGVVDRNGSDVSQLYELDLAIELDFVPERFDKITEYGERGVEACRAFEKQGIHYTRDASAAVRIDGSLRLIDFATHWVEPFHDD
ncbi:hypothetical protein [Phenylobacterium sp.]|uniref:hypothetical protein n=1 Tax=Phenylobacterium sp. TaxID=1871053 RepID=UPI0030F38224